MSASGSGDNLANPSHESRAMDPSTHTFIQPCIHRPFIHASIHGCAQHRNSWALSPTCVLWGQTINVRPPFHKPRDATSEPLAHRLHSPATPAPSSDLSPLSPQRPQRNPRSGNNFPVTYQTKKIERRKGPMHVAPLPTLLDFCRLRWTKRNIKNWKLRFTGRRAMR